MIPSDRPQRRHRLTAGFAAALVIAAITMLAPSPVSAAAKGGGTDGLVGITATCRQHTQAWTVAFGFGVLHTDVPGRTLTVPRGTPIFHTGIVVPNTRVVYHYARIGAPPPGVQFTVLSGFAGSNCVVPHEQSVLDTSIFGGTSWVVDAVYIAWETNQIRSTILGTLVVT